jgi:hypothetical protein
MKKDECKLTPVIDTARQQKEVQAYRLPTKSSHLDQYL